MGGSDGNENADMLHCGQCVYRRYGVRRCSEAGVKFLRVLLSEVSHYHNYYA